MTWFYYSLIAQVLFGASNYIDKLLLQKYFHGRGAGVLMVYSSVIGACIAPIIAFFAPEVFSVSPRNALLIMLSSAIILLALLLYFYALQQADTAVIVTLFQTIPIFGFVIGYVGFRELLTPAQMWGSLMVIAAAIGITIEPGRILRVNTRVLFLMLSASFLIAISGFIFKFVAIEDNFWTAAFWGYVGDATLGMLFLLFIKKYRHDFITSLRTYSLSLVGLNIGNELINVVAMLSLRFATLLAPLALVYSTSGMQPVLVFVYGVVLTRFFPSLGEAVSRRRMLQKGIAITAIVIGVYILNQ